MSEQMTDEMTLVVTTHVGIGETSIVVDCTGADYLRAKVRTFADRAIVAEGDRDRYMLLAIAFAAIALAEAVWLVFA